MKIRKRSRRTATRKSAPKVSVRSVRREHRTPGGPPNTWAKGNPGKAKGTKDKIPGQRVFKASIVSIMQEIAETEGLTIHKALMQGIKGGPRHADRYLKLMSEYLDGKPTDNLNIRRFDDDELATAEQRTDQMIARVMKQILEKRNASNAE